MKRDGSRSRSRAQADGSGLRGPVGPEDPVRPDGEERLQVRLEEESSWARPMGGPDRPAGRGRGPGLGLGVGPFPGRVCGPLASLWEGSLWARPAETCPETPDRRLPGAVGEGGDGGEGTGKGSLGSACAEGGPLPFRLSWRRRLLPGLRPGRPEGLWALSREPTIPLTVP